MLMTSPRHTRKPAPMQTVTAALNAAQADCEAQITLG